MYIKEMSDDPIGEDKEVDTIAKKFPWETRLSQLKKEVVEIVDLEYSALEEYAGEFIRNSAIARATRYVKMLLSGDTDAVRALFDKDSDRYRGIGYDKGDPWASVIHGSIFETDAISLLRKIVETHADIITDSRIKDLESIVEGLRKQIVKLEKQRNDIF